MLNVNAFANPTNHTCDSLICDGRPARWTIMPASAAPVAEASRPRACSVHLARVCEIVLEAAANKTTDFGWSYGAMITQSGVRRPTAGRRKG